MSKRAFKSQASSSRAGAGVGFGASGFGATHSSVLSYVQEPPDYSSISDANLVVSFKNLSKKDSTTKAKALEDLQSSLGKPENEIEDATIEAWVSLYPRLGIDNDRRVRQLAHNVNGTLCVRCGKRVAKQLPRLVGPWLAGTCDSDKVAARAAQDAVTAVFPSTEKIMGLRKTFQESVLRYCRDAIVDESVQTLSDERSVSAEDAAAIYARVISGCLTVISELLDRLSNDDIKRQSHLYEQIFTEPVVWNFVHHSDASVRRAMDRLVQKCLGKQPWLIEKNLIAVSDAYVYKGLASDQTGSSGDFFQTLASLTSGFPAIWTDAYNSKKPAVSRLQQCLRHGSRSGPSAAWESIRNIISMLPDQILPKSYDEIAALLTAARDGVTRKEERFNASASWPAYFSLVEALSRSMNDEEVSRLLSEFAMPPVNQYLQPSDEISAWTIGGAKPASVVTNVLLVKRIVPLLEHRWPQFADRVVDEARLSQPESSKDYEKSQRQVAAVGARWADLQRELWNSPNLPESLLASFAASNVRILVGCTALLTSRNGRPYGAAAIIEEQIRTCGDHLLKHSEYEAELVRFAVDDIPGLIFSPSQSHLYRCIFAVSGVGGSNKAVENILGAILNADKPSEEKLKAIHAWCTKLSSGPSVGTARASPQLQDFLATHLVAGEMGQNAGLVADLLGAGAVSGSTTEKILSGLLDGLSVSGSTLESSLVLVDHLSSSNHSMIQTFMSDSNGRGGELLPRIMRLEQSNDDDIAERAAQISSRLTTSMGNAGTDARYNMVIQSLDRTNTSPLPVERLIDVAYRIWEDGGPSLDFSKILPSPDEFLSSISEVMVAPKASLAAFGHLGGAVNLVESSTTSSDKRVHYDGEGFSHAMRTAMYLVGLLHKTGSLPTVPSMPSLAARLAICVLLAEDKLSIVRANSLWKSAATTEILEFTEQANVLLAKYRDSSSAAFFHALETLRLSDMVQVTPMVYYTALAVAKNHDADFKLHGYNSEQSESGEDELKISRADEDALMQLSCIVGYGEPLHDSAVLARYCNELVTDLTYLSLEYEKQATAAMEKLAILLAILNAQGSYAIDTIAKQRLVLFVKHVIPWTQASNRLALKAEVCRALTWLLPGMADMYGSHWEEMLDSLLGIWNSRIMVSEAGRVLEEGLLFTHSSLKLYAALEKLSQADEPNDDLVEALGEMRNKINDALIGLLTAANGVSDEAHQPLMHTHELLARQILRSPPKALKDAEDLYALLYTPSRAIQGAAFNLLHRHIPAAQEQISFDAALDNKVARLPDELLSLIVNAPTLDSLSDASFQDLMPSDLQGYLFSWRLLFDHFTGSSFRVKTDYVEQIKEGGYLNGLLSLTFDFLGHTGGRPIDAAKFNVQEYISDNAATPEKDVQWLLTHLYYLSLLNLPGLVKAYFLDLRSRQTLQAIESWTAKHISPFIITTNLETVAEWAQKSAQEDPDNSAMTIKVGMRSREINVSYEVDEQTMAIRVTLPETYPLASAQVTSIDRVAVKEEKWQAWLRNCQGVITFSNGSIIDGLSAWRKNVTGALKGQTECAICYSIISADKQLPTKRCPTCKNLFHSSCLFKWFKTSNSSTCPLCRNPFNFN